MMKIGSLMSGRTAPLTALAGALAATMLSGSALAANTGKITVVHAVPGLTVDVYANESLFLEDFKPGTITRPTVLDPGEYEIEVTPANSPKEVLEADARVKRGTEATAVAYLDKKGDPTLGLFKDNDTPVDDDKARLTVRHTAAAPRVDVRFKRPGGEWKTAASDLINGDQATRNLDAKRYRFDVVLAGTDDRVLGPVTLKLERRTHYFVYAWGSAADGSLGLNLSTARLPASD